MEEYLPFLAGMEVDRVLTAQQVRKWHGVNLTEVDFLVWRHVRRVKPSQTVNKGYREVSFVSLEKPPQRESDLKHLFGTAEIRRLLGAHSSLWDNMATRGGKESTPDAVLRLNETAKSAIEYDTGSYKGSVILRKAEAFRRFDAQVWGCPNPRRAEFVRALVTEVHPAASVIVADPYSDLLTDVERQLRDECVDVLDSVSGSPDERADVT